MIIISNNYLTYESKDIPKFILGNATFIGEPYFGHRARLYQLDFNSPETIAKLIIDAYNEGCRSINLFNNVSLIEAYNIACEEGCEMEIVATIGKSEDNLYIKPDYDMAKKVNWKEDIKIFSKMNTSIMIIDEFIVDGYDWDLTSKILNKINDTKSFSGLSTAFPIKSSDLIKNNLDLSLFDFYMIPLNKLAYMMDIPSLLDNEKEILKNKISSLNKKIIASKTLATGILTPKEGFDFINSLDYVDLISVSIANQKELKEDIKYLIK